jgi:iron(III) transport system substrate-binding protein
MRKLGWRLLVVAIVLALPLLLRRRGEATDETGEVLTIITPHNEIIRDEFSLAFERTMSDRRGRKVTIDWRTPGGTSEIIRYLMATTHTGIDLFFGGGSSEMGVLSQAGLLEDSGVVRAHPERFGDGGIPASFRGARYWDPKGRWIGTCLAEFGICYNHDVLQRLGLAAAPTEWSDLADPAYFGQVELADPTKAGSAAAAFDMIVQQQMRSTVDAQSAAPGSDAEARAVAEGWSRAMRLIRRIAANSRYFVDSASKVPVDVASGEAAAGMCIDFFGRFQAETLGPGRADRIVFVKPRGGTSLDADPIALLVGAPHRDLAVEFIDFVMSDEGQKLWGFKRGEPGGPVRHALRRLPIAPNLYERHYDALRSDPEDRPYDDEGPSAFAYQEGWTGRKLLGPLKFVVQVMCMDPQEELSQAYRALATHGFPAEATALFDDVTLVDYEAAQGEILRALGPSADPSDRMRLTNRLSWAIRAQYRRVEELAVEGQ